METWDYTCVSFLRLWILCRVRRIVGMETTMASPNRYMIAMGCRWWRRWKSPRGPIATCKTSILLYLTHGTRPPRILSLPRHANLSQHRLRIVPHLPLSYRYEFMYFASSNRPTTCPHSYRKSDTTTFVPFISQNSTFLFSFYYPYLYHSAN